MGRCIARSELRRFETSTERILEARRRRTHQRSDANGRVILTAAEQDRALQRPALHFLVSQAASLYVDVRESGDPDREPEGYDLWLRTCLAHGRSLVLVATQEGLASKWVPWQLGLAEGFLGRENVAVLPVDDYVPFRGSALVEIYPTIRRREGAWVLVWPGGRPGPLLGDWLTQGAGPARRLDPVSEPGR